MRSEDSLIYEARLANALYVLLLVAAIAYLCFAHELYLVLRVILILRACISLVFVLTSNETHKRQNSVDIAKFRNCRHAAWPAFVLGAMVIAVIAYFMWHTFYSQP